MKKKEFTDLRKKEPKELVKMVFAKRLEARKAKLSLTAGKEKNLKTYRNIRRDIAQLETVIREKQIMESLKVKEETE